MRSFESERTAGAITDAIDQYLDSGMGYDEICRAIDDEWPHQIAVMLREFLLKTTCPHCMSIVSFLKTDQQDGPGTVYVPVCDCELEPLEDAFFEDDENAEADFGEGETAEEEELPVEDAP